MASASDGGKCEYRHSRSLGNAGGIEHSTALAAATDKRFSAIAVSSKQAHVEPVKSIIPDICVDTEKKSAAKSGFLCLIMRRTSYKAQDRAGVFAFFVLSGSYIAKCTAKTMHREGKISCYAYRKWREITTTQPWFAMPLIGVALFNRSSLALQPPRLAYALLFIGWLTNTIGHAIQLTSGPDACSDSFIPISYWLWVGSMSVGCIGLIINALKNCT
ncbi:uncharacterized protein [Watersipora subatra]|uniref:uncharacterized protein n=1 Tax=Watersipora subatra TaxID=2589382 RepID=UPI00355B3E3D